MLTARRGAGIVHSAPVVNWREWGAAAVGLLAALALRLFQYQSIPHPAPNPDEWNWMWFGLSQLEGKPATGWTLFWTAYPPANVVPPPPPFYEPLAHPYLDAPPLFAWIAGAAAWLNGDRTLTDTIHDPGPRLVGIALAVIAAALAFALGRRVLGVAPALVGLFLFAVAPASVVLGRLVAAEQLLAVLLLASLLAVYQLRRAPGDRRWLLVLVACCLLAPLAKAPGLAVGASAAILLLSRRQFRLAAFAVGAALGGQALVLIYSATQDWHTYTELARLRGLHLSALTGYRFIAASMGFDNQQMFDGWWLLGWLSLAELFSRRHGDWDLLTVPAIVYLVAIVGMTADYSGSYGWYRLTVFPIVYLAAGRFLWRAAAEPSVPRLALSALLGLATLANFAAPLQFKPTPLILGAVIAVAVLPGLASFVSPSWRREATGAALALLVLLLPVSVIEVLSLSAIFGR
jgi:4-amino-4-deoxy-L-arabinose transferase-like glycosyltransferase